MEGRFSFLTDDDHSRRASMSSTVDPGAMSTDELLNAFAMNYSNYPPSADPSVYSSSSGNGAFNTESSPASTSSPPSSTFSASHASKAGGATASLGVNNGLFAAGGAQNYGGGATGGYGSPGYGQELLGMSPLSFLNQSTTGSPEGGMFSFGAQYPIYGLLQQQAQQQSQQQTQHQQGQQQQYNAYVQPQDPAAFAAALAEHNRQLAYLSQLQGQQQQQQQQQQHLESPPSGSNVSQRSFSSPQMNGIQPDQLMRSTTSSGAMFDLIDLSGDNNTSRQQNGNSKKRKMSDAGALPIGAFSLSNSQQQQQQLQDGQQQMLHYHQILAAQQAASGGQMKQMLPLKGMQNQQQQPGGRGSVGLISNAGVVGGQVAREPMYHLNSDVPSISIARSAQQKTIPEEPEETKRGKKAAPKKGAAAAAAAPEKKKGKGADKGHNAVERRYRNNINNHIATLRDTVPALRHLKPLPSMPQSKRRASQFTLVNPTPTPDGLVDGIPAAKTLSKGTILGKAIEYIVFLQSAREDLTEDLDMLKGTVKEMVGRGEEVVKAYEDQRAIRELQREKARASRRAEAAADEDGESGDEDEAPAAKEPAAAVKKEANTPPSFVFGQQSEGSSSSSRGASTEPPPSAGAGQQMEGVQALQQHLASLQNQLPPSLLNQLSSLIQQAGPTHQQDTIMQHQFPGQQQQQQDWYTQHQVQQQGHGPPRMLMAAFMGLSFAGGLGYDAVLSTASSAGSPSGGAARAWATELVKRAAPNAAAPAQAGGWASSVLMGLVGLGFASIVAAVVLMLYPSSSSKNAAPLASTTRSAYRQRRRAEGLAALQRLSGETPRVRTKADELAMTLRVRRELLKLVGAPTYGFLPALGKEALATALRKVTTIRVGSFSHWDEADRIEAAVAWIRIAEIEASAPTNTISWAARCYTFLRLFNLSRSQQWPTSTPTTNLPTVNAILAVHLLGLGQTVSAKALWSHARSSRKKTDARLDAWCDVALTASFEEVKALTQLTEASFEALAHEAPSPSDSVPLLRISEARCAATLKEVWGRIFVAVVQTTCPPHAPFSPFEAFAEIANQPMLEETVVQTVASTIPGTEVHTLALITSALCSFYNGKQDAARSIATGLLREAQLGGPAARLVCTSAFFRLILQQESAGSDPDIVPGSECDVLASTTLGWLVIRRQVNVLVSRALERSSAPTSRPGSPLETAISKPLPSAASITLKPDRALHSETLRVRRLLGSSIFGDEELALACSAPSDNASPDTTTPTVRGSSKSERAFLVSDVATGGLVLDFEAAHSACVDALTDISRRAAGLTLDEDDSGVEL